MQLLDELERQGTWLFRYRGTFGTILLPLIGAALRWPGLPVAGWSDLAVDRLTAVGLAVSMLGLLLRAAIVGFVPAGTSGRNAREQRAHALNTTGMYSMVRHPLYLANATMMFGFAIGIGSLWFLAIVMLGFTLFIERIIATEEAFLAATFGEQHAIWAKHTPAFWPSFALWKSTPMKFSARTVMRREYNGFMGVALAFFAIELVRDVGFAGESLQDWVRQEPQWWILLLTGIVVFVVLRTLKRATRLLHVAGR
jgi:protein-S-isoprenylcysteine O-methyltransferase Ste14